MLGAVLAASGHSVTLIVRPGTTGRHPPALTLDSPFGAIQAPVTVAEQLGRAVDVLWLAPKATQLAASLAQIPEPGRAGLVIPLLNGVDHIQPLMDRFGAERVVPATIAVESERRAPGHIVVRSPFIRLRLSARARSALGTVVADLERFGFDGAFVDDELSLMWSKLVFLAPIALSTTAARATIGEVLSRPADSIRLEQCVHEACAVASILGARVDAGAVMAGIRSLPAGMRSSMQKDQAAGHPLELDAIAGPIIRTGHRHRIPVPATEELATTCRQQGTPS